MSCLPRFRCVPRFSDIHLVTSVRSLKSKYSTVMGIFSFSQMS